MILELHGDACRLGYLKLAACILEDGSPRSPDYLASVMLETCRSLEEDVERSLPGLMRSEVNARNYVKLANDLGFYNRKTGRLGRFGAAYACLDSSETVKKHVSGERCLSLSQLLSLSPVEKMLFLQAILTMDYYMMVLLVKWLFKTREFTRQNAMQAVMEEIYPEALQRLSRRLSDRDRHDLAKELEEASRFRERRESYSSKVEWIRSRQYAKYRHTVPPRLEWLADVGLLERTHRGRYAVSPEGLRLFRDLELVVSRPRERVEEEFFKYVVLGVERLKAPAQSTEAQAMTSVYSSLNKMMGRVELDLLCLASAYKLVERGFKSSPSSMMRVFSYLSLLYPDRVYATYSDDGSAEVSGLDISLVE
ncbi:MAG: hypothetical protein QXV86_00235 [Candidatus Caldarchaeum sp.]